MNIFLHKTGTRHRPYIKLIFCLLKNRDYVLILGPSWADKIPKGFKTNFTVLSPGKKCSLLRWNRSFELNYWPQFFLFFSVNLQFTLQTMNYISLYFELGFYDIICFSEWQARAQVGTFKCVIMIEYFLLCLSEKKMPFLGHWFKEGEGHAE